IGFKRSYINFSDIYMGSVDGSNSNLGMGTRVNSVKQDFSLGRIETSSSGLDLSLANSGFFVQRDHGTGLTSYTRAGRLNFDSNGYLVGFGGVIQGFPALNGVVQHSGNLVDLQLPKTALPAQSTAKIGMGVNLNSNENLIATPFNATDPTTYNYRSDETIYDSLGNPYVASMFYVKTADNAWTTQFAVDNTVLGTGALSFSDTGALSASTGLSNLAWTPANGAAAGSLSVDLTGSTQYAGSNQFYNQSQNGCPSGMPIGCAIDGNGYLNVSYSNGMSLIQGQIAVAQFNSDLGLSKSDSMSWVPTTESGSAIIDPNASQSAFLSNSIEYSNVDLTQELVNLISAQHDFQANAQAQQTYNQVLQTIEKL
ncbi:MAG: flagellar hook protein FlgE, partial [Legionellales bacterium]